MQWQAYEGGNLLRNESLEDRKDYGRTAYVKMNQKERGMKMNPKKYFY
jgi:hypothetical protein